MPYIPPPPHWLALNMRLVKAAKHCATAGAEIEKLLDLGADPVSSHANAAVKFLIQDAREWSKHSASIKRALRALAESGNELTEVTRMAYSFIADFHYVTPFAEEIRVPDWKTERLADAIACDNLKRVKRILQAGGDPSGKDDNDQSLPLDWMGETLLNWMKGWYSGSTQTTTIREGIQGGTVPVFNKASEPQGPEEIRTEIARLLIDAGFDVLRPAIVKAVEERKWANAISDLVAEEIKKRQAELPPPPKPPVHGPIL